MAKYRNKTPQRFNSYSKNQRKHRRRSYRGRSRTISNELFGILMLSAVFVFIIWQQNAFDMLRFLPIILLVLVVLIAVVVGLLLWLRYREHQRMVAYKRSEVEQLDGIVFEHYLAALLKEEGYSQVKITPAQADYGADLFANKDGTSYAIQAKRYADRNLVGVHAVQEISSAREFYDKDKAMVITTGYFSDNAKIMAKKNGIELIDKPKLSAIIAKHAK